MNEVQSCRDTKINTPTSTDSTTTIECTGLVACTYAEIDYLGDATSSPSTHSINLICADGACLFMEINVTNAGIILELC